MRFCILIVLAVVILPVSGYSEDIQVTSGSPAEEKLAALDLKRNDIPRSSIAPYGRALDVLSSKCKEARSHIGDMAFVGAQNLLKEKGIKLSSLEFLTAMERSLDGAKSNKGMSCAEIAAILLVTIK